MQLTAFRPAEPPAEAAAPPVRRPRRRRRWGRFAGLAIATAALIAYQIAFAGLILMAIAALLLYVGAVPLC